MSPGTVTAFGEVSSSLYLISIYHSCCLYLTRTDEISEFLGKGISQQFSGAVLLICVTQTPEGISNADYHLPVPLKQLL